MSAVPEATTDAKIAPACHPAAEWPLNLRHAPPQFHAQARQAFAARDAEAFMLATGDNTRALALVVDNLGPLREAGLYEAALLSALIDTRTNHHAVDPWLLGVLVRAADRERLRAAGEPLPGPGPFTLYRGVAGVGRARRVRGLHWTGDRDRAVWFARRWPWMPKPAICRVTVPADDVLTYTAARSEDEYLVLLPDTVRVTVTRIAPTTAAAEVAA